MHLDMTSVKITQ